MNSTLNSGRIAAALVALWATLAGGSAAPCAAMPDCPAMVPACEVEAMAPAGGCHAAAGGVTRVEESVYCSCGVGSRPLSSASSETTSGLGLAATALFPAVVAASPSTGGSAALPRPPGRLPPSGRDRLSLHQTLLI